MMNHTFRKCVSATLIFLLAQGPAYAAATDLATSPLVTSPSSSVLPNLFFVLDDSGSMDWDYIPDWANSGNAALFKNTDYNGVAYDPAVTYSPPIYYNADGSINTTTYLPMNGANTQGSCGADFCSVKNDGYGIQSTSKSDLRNNATYYTFIPGEYCTAANLRSCNEQAAPNATYPFPAVLRWCRTSTAANAAPDPTATTCQASRVENGTTYLNARYAGMKPPTSTITITTAGQNTTTIASVKVNGFEILTATTAASTSGTQSTRNNDNATNITSGVNACTAAKTGNCTIAGYSASRSSNVVTITAPASVGNVSGVAAYTPVVTAGVVGGVTLATTAFTGGLPGQNIKVDIVSTTDAYVYPNTTARAASRTDCTGVSTPLTCTYAEEMTNYANWWAYYHTRMQMMKSSASIAFRPVDTKYRVGFMTINHNVSGGFLNLGVFDNAQKKSWYDKFFASNPNNSTPLREALSVAGRYYAGKLNGSTVAGVTVTEPLQYSCQQNFTLLTTDGYWNGNDGFKLDGSSAVGNQDGIEPRPYNDGANLIVSVVTPSVTTVRKESVQAVKRDTVSTRVNTVIGAACSTTGVVPSSCVQDNGVNGGSGTRTWCITSSIGSNSECSAVLGSGGAYACRGSSNATNLPGSGSPQACRTDSSGQNWCIYTNNTTGTACVKGIASGGDIGNNVYACKPPAGVTGSQVTVQNQSSTFTETGATSTSIDDTATTTNSTVVTTNGVAAPAQANTPAGSVVTTNVSVAVTAYTSNSTSAWTTTSSTGPTCTATASLPAAGTTTPVAAAPVVSTVGSATVTTVSTTGPVVGTPVTSSTSSTGGTSDTLADVAEYYYITDLRTSALSNCTGAVVPPASTGFDVCSNDVAGSGLDTASWQHMTTFTLGLANGVMQYSPTYQTQTTGDFFDVKNGSTANGTSVCGWQTSGACNWPTPASDSQNNIDDLWHAAVNGRGVYFSATNPTALAAGLNSALAGVNARTGASAAATTSNPNVTSGDNFVFSSTFTTNEWDGELIRQQLDLVTGAVSSTVDWSAQGQLDLLAYGSRVIYTLDPADTTNQRKLFTHANLTATEQTYFDATSIASLSQLCTAGTCLDAGIKANAAGANLVNFIRGDRSNEGAVVQTDKLYRVRQHVLGDIVNAEAVYVKTPLFNYGDSGFGAHLSAMASRQGTVYVAANDGMLHAFNSSTGAETWAYVPTLVMPTLYKLADKNYTAQHRYFVDGTPVSGEVFDGTNWRTIVVAGMNSGGKGYYALDVTDPASPKVLWEFTHNDMGYTYGNPIISKLRSGVLQSDGTTSVAGKWVVFATSGYNNNASGQDGKGRLYIIDAVTGALIRTIVAGASDATAGDTTTPSGLAKINAWVDDTASDNTTLRVYGGDLLGNLWRFDVNDIISPSGYEAQKLIALYADGNASTAGTIRQPITTKPELGEVSSIPVIYVGTGRYLGITDLTDTTKQTFYAVKDALGTTTLGNPRDTSASGPNFVQQVATNTTCPAGSPVTICTTGQKVRTSTANTVNFTGSNNNGWFIDLPDSGERANTDPTLALGTIGFTTNIPNTSACTAGGNSFRWLLDYKSGAPVSTSTTKVSSVSLGNALATRAVFVRLPNNTVVQLTRMSDGTTVTTNVPIGAGTAATRRVSWRELIQDQ